MTITAAGIEQYEGPLSPDSHPLAALAVERGDLPEFLSWQVDEADGSRFTVMKLGERVFALETDDQPPYEVTVYGTEAGEALDQLFDALRVDNDAVLDRSDRHHAATATSEAHVVTPVAGFRATTIESHLFARLSALEQQLARDAAQRRLGAVLELGGDELTPRQRMAVALLSAGLTPEEAAERMGVLASTVSKYTRAALKHHTEFESPDPARTPIPPTLKEWIGSMRRNGMTLQAIADRLNAEGIPTLRGSAWRPSSVQAAAGYKRPSRARTSR